LGTQTGGVPPTKESRGLEDGYVWNWSQIDRRDCEIRDGRIVFLGPLGEIRKVKIQKAGN